MKKRAAALLLVLAVLTIAFAPCANASQSVKYVYTRNGKPLNVRSWPSLDASLLGTIPNGTKVTIEGYSNDYTWATLVYKGQIAYVMTQYLVDYNPVKPTPTSVPTGDGNYRNIVNSMENEFRTYRVVEPYIVLAKPTRATGWVNLRYAPSTDFGHAENLYANTQLTVIAETANWLQVRKNDTGVTGYVMRKFTISMGVGSGY